MKPISRIMIALAALALLVLLVVPVWRIDLQAPQYPEGLYMQIWADHFSGDVEKINGLNHYIGMATIHDEMFPEFVYLPKVLMALSALGVLAALWGRRWALFAGLVTLSAFGLWALYDMWKWGYDYGHNLDPRAAIKVEDMAYQPPLIGHKQLLNFDAWSTPDIGGWILFGVMGLLAGVYFLELREEKNDRYRYDMMRLGSLLPLFALALLSCGQQEPRIDFGKAECAHCRMNVVDRQYGAVLVTVKGRQYVFDDLSCMVHFVEKGTVAESQVATWYVCDHASPGSLIDATKALYLYGPAFRSPMRGDVAAFAVEGMRTRATADGQARPMDWAEVRQHLKQ